MTSPLARVPRAHQVAWLIESLTNLTLPSAIRIFTPPGWLLLAVTNSASPMAALEQKPQGYMLGVGRHDGVEHRLGLRAVEPEVAAARVQLAGPVVPGRVAGLQTRLDRGQLRRGVQDLRRGRGSVASWTMPAAVVQLVELSPTSASENAIVFDVPSMQCWMPYDLPEVNSPVLLGLSSGRRRDRRRAEAVVVAVQVRGARVGVGRAEELVDPREIDRALDRAARRARRPSPS